MAATLSSAQSTQVAAITAAYKAQQNRDAARIATLIALYYQTRVDPEDPQAVEDWIALMVPRLIAASDVGALRAAAYFQAVRQVENPRLLDGFTPTPARGVIDDGVRQSLLAVGPGDFVNKMHDVAALKVDPQQARALAAQAKQVTTEKVASAVMRHAQAGARQTIFDNSRKDKVALGYIRVTKDNPCFFCAMLASRGLSYRPFKEDSFADSNAMFTGDGNAKVHDNCGCSLKPVYAKNDPLVAKTQKFADMWSMWGAGGGDAALRFRRGYDHFQKTGEYLTWDEANAGLRVS